MGQDNNTIAKVKKKTRNDLLTDSSLGTKIKSKLIEGFPFHTNATREKSVLFKKKSLSPTIKETDTYTASNLFESYEDHEMYKFRLPKYRLGYDNEASGIGNLQAEPKLPSIRTSSTDSFRNDDEDDNTRPSMDVSILDDAASSVCIDDYDLGLAGAAVNYLDPILRNGDVQTLRQAKDNIMNDETLTDFDKFNQQTATDMYIQEKLCTVALEREKKQLKRSKRRNKGKSRINNDSSQFYGNYFTSIDPSAESENTFLRREDSEPNGNAISLRHRHVVKVNFSNSFDGKVTEDLEANSIKLSHVTPDISNFANAQGGILSVKSRSKASRKVTFDNGAFVTNATPLDDNSTTGSFDGDTLESIETIIVDVPHAGRDNIYTFPSGQNFCGSYQSGYSIDGRYGRGLQRKLLPRHLPTITFGLTLGAGLFFASGQALLVAGPLGALLAYISVAVIVVCTVLSITELTAYIPMVSGIVGLSSRFVDDAFGFAMGICYWFMFAIALPSHVTAASALLNYYPGFLVPAESIVPWITLFLALIVIVNLLDVRLYGEIKYGLSIVTTVLLLGLLVLMFCSNLGVVGPRFEYVGFKYWDNRQSNLTDNLIYGLFKPFFQTDGKNSIEIEGNLGRFLSVWAAMLIATYSFLGTEAVITTTGEARNPRRSIPSAVKRIFAYVLFFFLLSIFALGLNVYAGDPRLLTRSPQNRTSIFSLDGSEYINIYEKRTSSTSEYCNGNNSPWIIAIKNAGLDTTASVYNGLFIFFSISSGISALYGSSRILYSLSENGKFFKMFAKCSSLGVPYRAVLLSTSFSLLAYLSASYNSSKIFFWLMNLSTSAGLIVWVGMSLTYLRFYYGLKCRPDLFLRRTETSPFLTSIQPYAAYVSLIGSLLMIVTAGFPLLLKGQWDSTQFMLIYMIPMFFIVLFATYKVTFKTKFVSTNDMDFDGERLVMDEEVWDEERFYTGSTKYFFKSLLRMII